MVLDSGVLLDNGIRADAALRVLDSRGTPIPAVVAAGDCVRWPHPLFDDHLVRIEHWSNAVDQAGAAARTLLQALTTHKDPQPPPFAGVPSFWSDQLRHEDPLGRPALPSPRPAPSWTGS